MSRKRKKFCATLNCIEHFLILASTITGFISSSAFTSLISISIGIRSSAVVLGICAITEGKKRISKNWEKEKNLNKIILLTQPKSNRIEALFSKSLADSNISHDEFVFINNVLKEMKERLK